MHNLQMRLIGSADFANGESFDVFQFEGRTTCAVRNNRTGEMSRAGTEAKAWASVRYQARIGQVSERTYVSDMPR